MMLEDVPEKIVNMANEGRKGAVDAREVVIPDKSQLKDDFRVKGKKRKGKRGRRR